MPPKDWHLEAALSFACRTSGIFAVSAMSYLGHACNKSNSASVCKPSCAKGKVFRLPVLCRAFLTPQPLVAHPNTTPMAFHLPRLRAHVSDPKHSSSPPSCLEDGKRCLRFGNCFSICITKMQSLVIKPKSLSHLLSSG